MATEAQKRASAKYDAENTVQLKIKLNKKTDKDIIDRLSEVEQKATYVKALIRDDIKKSPRI